MRIQMNTPLPMAVLSKERESQLLEKFYLLFSAQEGKNKIKDSKNLKFVLQGGVSVIISGKSLGYIPGEFVKKPSEKKDGGSDIVSEECSKREYIPGKCFYGINLSGEFIEIPLSEVDNFDFQ